MKIGEVCLMTDDVIRLADFYRTLFGIKDDSEKDNDVHQFIFKEETTFTIYNDGTERPRNFQNICLAFTVDDVDAEYKRLKGFGIEISTPPTQRPWGAKNMSFNDPDGNSITFRSFPPIV